MFPLDRLNTVTEKPEDFTLLEILPALKWELPLTLHTPQSETITIAVVDTETTGIDAKKDDVIELGFVIATVEMATGKLCTVKRMGHFFNEPKEPIPELITQITGITDDDVRGHAITMSTIMEVFSGIDLIVAHNAKFDRAFIDNHIAELGFAALPIPWACSIYDVDWRTLQYESNSLGYLLFKKGYFFNAHRASIDCLATLFMLHVEGEALVRVVKAAFTPIIDLRVSSRFEAKDALKALGCQWDGELRQWHKVISGTQDDIDKEISKLKTADSIGKVVVEPIPCSPLSCYAS